MTSKNNPAATIAAPTETADDVRAAILQDWLNDRHDARCNAIRAKSELTDALTTHGVADAIRLYGDHAMRTERIAALYADAMEFCGWVAEPPTLTDLRDELSRYADGLIRNVLRFATNPPSYANATANATEHARIAADAETGETMRQYVRRLDRAIRRVAFLDAVASAA